METISVSGQEFKMIMTSETDGYYLVSRTYDLYFKEQLIAKDVGSIKSCYNLAADYVQSMKER